MRNIKQNVTLNQAEAKQAWREPRKLHDEFVLAEFVGIITNPEGVKLKIKCVQETHGRKIINEYLEKRTWRCNGKKILLLSKNHVHAHLRCGFQGE
jgi:hypothetical protein